MLSCPRCAGANAEDGTFCQYCGASLAGASPVSTTTINCADLRHPQPGRNELLPQLRDAPGRRPSDGERTAPSPVLTPGPSTGTAVAASGRVRLVGVRRDGTDGSTYEVPGEQFDIGRSEGDLLFDDPHMAARHARLTLRDGQHYITPLETRNGVYVRVRQPVELLDGDQFLIGKQVMRFEIPFEVEKALRPAVEQGVVFFGTPVKPPWGRLRQLTAAGTSRDIYHLTRAEVTLGREQGDIVFGDDEFLSRRHAQVCFRGNRVTLVDLGSSNGTFVRLRNQHLLTTGDLIRIGDELLRFEIG